MKLTKRQRNRFYKLAKEKDICWNGLCSALSEVVEEQLKVPYVSVEEIPDLFPEFSAKKPKNYDLSDSAYWWPLSNKSIRIKVLNKCIAETTSIKKK